MEQYAQMALDACTDLLVEGMEKKEILDTLSTTYANYLDKIEAHIDDWYGLDALEVPEPSAQMHAQFYKMLSTQQANITPPAKANLGARIVTLLKNPQLQRWSLAASFLLAGLFIGIKIAPNQNGQMNDLAYQLDSLRHVSFMALINNEYSPRERLKGMQVAKGIQDSATMDAIIATLSQTLQNDPNVNVRLSAIETLLHYGDNPAVRSALIESIPKQTNPMVQITLAETMQRLQVTQSAPAWNEILSSDSLDPDFEQALKEALQPIL